MRINIISDIHLEFGDLVLPGGDILILAGDACESRTLTRHPYNPADPSDPIYRRPDRAARFFQVECAKYRHVIYVMGNHEHYHSYLHKTYDEIKACMPANVHLLEQEHIEIDGVLFLGATMWTDCNRNDPSTLHTLRHGMNDYRVITYMDSKHNNWRKLHPSDTVAVFSRTIKYFKKVLAANPGKPTVVVTHHAPTYKSINEIYIHDKFMNGGYASDVSDLILDNPQIKCWVHGHMHDPVDYLVGDTQVLSNPRGYLGHEHQADTFSATVGFDIWEEENDLIQQPSPESGG
jgi:predicted phosphodiesterase